MFHGKSKQNVCLATLFVMMFAASSAFGATWELSPSTNYYLDKVTLKVAMVAQPNASKAPIEKVFASQKVRDAWSNQTGALAEPNFAMSILAGMPQDFLGTFVDWRNPAFATKCARYLVEQAGFTKNNVGVCMIQDGYGVSTGKHQTFRIYFPCFYMNGQVYVMLDRDYMESVGVAPETTRLIWLTNNITTYWTAKEPPLHPFPAVVVESTTQASTAVTSTANTIVSVPVVTSDCGCDHDNSGKDGRTTNPDGKGNNNIYNGNSDHCKEKLH